MEPSIDDADGSVGQREITRIELLDSEGPFGYGTKSKESAGTRKHRDISVSLASLHLSVSLHNAVALAVLSRVLPGSHQLITDRQGSPRFVWPACNSTSISIESVGKWDEDEYVARFRKHPAHAANRDMYRISGRG